MHSIKTTTLLILVFMAATGAIQLRAQEPVRSDYEQVLLPIYFRSPVVGVNGSRWQADMEVRNTSDEKIVFSSSRPVCYVTCPDGPPSLSPRSTRGLTDHATVLRAIPGVFYYVQRTRAADVVFSTRLHELSSADDLGVEIPVVREPAFKNSPIEIIGVPLSARHRITLRVYGSAPSQQDVQVEFFDDRSGAVLGEMSLSLFGILDDDPEFPEFPSYGWIPNIQSVVPSGSDKIRVRISPLENSPAIWAFVSLADNQTQRVTIVTPQ